MRRLCRDDLWLSVDAFKMVRLMGKHAIEMVDDLDVTRVFLSSLTMFSAPKAGPERESFDWNTALIKMLVTFDVESEGGIAASVAKQCEPFARRLAELPLARLAPKDEVEARESLMLVIDHETRRLQEMLLMLRSIASADLAEAPSRLAFETGPEGDRHRRYELSNERLALQSYDRFLRTRNFVVTGRFDLIDVDLQTLVGPAPPHAFSDVSGPLSVVCSPLSVVSSPLSVVSGPLSVVNCKSDAINEPEASDEVSLAAVAERTEQVPRAILPSAANGGEQRDVPAPCEVGQQTPAPSPQEQIGCDDEPIVRNEANLSDVSGPFPDVIPRAGGPETFREGEPPCEPSASAGSDGASPSPTFPDGEPPCEPSAYAGSDGASPSQERGPETFREGEPPCEQSAYAGSDGASPTDNEAIAAEHAPRLLVDERLSRYRELF